MLAHCWYWHIFTWFWCYFAPVPSTFGPKVWALTVLRTEGVVRVAHQLHARKSRENLNFLVWSFPTSHMPSCSHRWEQELQSSSNDPNIQTMIQTLVQVEWHLLKCREWKCDERVRGYMQNAVYKWWLEENGGWGIPDYFASTSVQNWLVYLFLYLLFIVYVKLHPLHLGKNRSSCHMFIRVFLD